MLQQRRNQIHCSNNVSLGVSAVQNQPGLVKGVVRVKIRQRHFYADKPHFPKVSLHVEYSSNTYRKRCSTILCHGAVREETMQQQNGNQRRKNGNDGRLRLHRVQTVMDFGGFNFNTSLYSVTTTSRVDHRENYSIQLFTPP